MRLNIEDIARYTGGTVILPASGDTVAESVTWDSREVEPGCLYVALRGERVDGHDFAAAACAAGAVAVLASHALGESAMDALEKAKCALVMVEDTEEAFTRLARGWRGHLQGTVVGITGSSGKTTTKNLVRDVLASGMTVVATKANQNNELGVPRTVLSADADTQAVVVEMGMRGRGQIAELCEFVRPAVGLVTNVGTSHIELLGSREGIASAKGELYAALPEDGIAIVNADDDFAPTMLRAAQVRERGVHTVLYDGTGAWRQADCLSANGGEMPRVWASEISFDAMGCASFILHASQFAALGLSSSDGEHPCTLGLAGAHNVTNACAAAAVGITLGLSLAQCCAALAQAQPEQGRQQVLQAPGGVMVVDDSYNANPDSMRASLATFKEMEVAGRRIAVLGDMGELGSHAAEGHRQVGVAAAGSGLDALVCVGELARGIAAAALDAGFPAAAITEVADGPEALAALQGSLQGGDAVLVKASHSMKLEEVVKGLMS